MKNVTKISVFFALTILFAGSANAQYNIPDITPAHRECSNEIPESIKSPSGACQYWRSSAVCKLDEREFSVNQSGDDCKVKALNAVIGSFHFYYSGNEFCKEEFIGTPYYSKKCAQRTDIAQPTTKTTQPTKQQQQKTSPKVVAPKEQPKTTATSDNQAWNQLLSINNMLTKAIFKTETALKGFFDNMFVNAKNFFRKN